MTAYPDMSPYSYSDDPCGMPDGTTALNVGWLDRGSHVPVGEPPQGFLEALAEICQKYAYNRMRGWHRCSLEHPNGKPDYPLTVSIAGQKKTLGSAEIRLIAVNGDWLIAPNLVYHYVADHGYLPSEEFIEAVMAHRVAPPSPW